MPGLIIVYWRDIPAQVIVGKGRTAAKRPLPERFEKAIDRAAMKAGLSGTDDYLGQWRREGPVETPGDPAAIATAEAARIDAEYSQDRLQQLVNNAGQA